MSINNFINRSFGFIERKLSVNRINWFYTLYFNFRTLPFNIACKLPVYIYGKIELVSLNGSVSFDCIPVKGMVKIGRHRDYYTPPTKTVVKISKLGQIVFRGYCSISQGTIINITDGCLTFGDRVWIGQSVLLDCNNSIQLGEGTGITYGCKLSDSNHHYIIDEDGNIPRIKGLIEIGRYNWIGNNTLITKGCKTTDYTICTHGSLLNKNYPQKYDSDKSMLLAGTPAKLLKVGCERIFPGKLENEIIDFFKTHSNESVMPMHLPQVNNTRELSYYK